nr:MAG TPA: BNR/Asp-box repeat protein [Caudoviricetes sp.]
MKKITKRMFGLVPETEIFNDDAGTCTIKCNNGGRYTIEAENGDIAILTAGDLVNNWHIVSRPRFVAEYSNDHGETWFTVAETMTYDPQETVWAIMDWLEWDDQSDVWVAILDYDTRKRITEVLDHDDLDGLNYGEDLEILG